MQVQLRVCVLTIGLAGIPFVAFAQDAASNSPSRGAAVARTAAGAVLGQEVPDDLQPLMSIASVLDEPEGILPEPRFVGRMINLATRTIGDGSGMSNGVFPEFSNMITGSGWISIGPGYRQWMQADRVYIDASSAVSWRGYKMAQGRFELPKLANGRVIVGSQAMWQDLTQVTYFGAGPDTIADTRSEYRLTSTDLVGYVTVRPREWLSIGMRAGWLGRPTIDTPSGVFKRGNPSTLAMFPADPAVALGRQPNYTHSEAFVVVDTRNSRSHPAGGGVYRAAVTQYTDHGAGVFSFERYEGEAAHFLNFFREKLVVAGHAWIAASNTAGSNAVPFYLMPSLGGNDTLRGYTDFRFHDRNFALAQAEVRVALIKHVDVAAFFDAGNVAARVADLNFDKHDWGVGFRVHTNRATVGRLDVAHGADGWQLVFRTSEPLHLGRLSRRLAAIPFVP